MTLLSRLSYLLIAGAALWPLSASASVISFDVEAVNGPVPSAITTGASFNSFNAITFFVAPDPQERAITGSDATLDYSISVQPVTYAGCNFTGPLKPNICSGTISYQVWGLAEIDAGISGDFGFGSNTVEEFGQMSGTLDLRAGTYTLMAEANTAYNGPADGEVLTPSGAAGFIDAHLTVAAGDASVAPEPGTMALMLFCSLLPLSKWIAGGIRGKRR